MKTLAMQAGVKTGRDMKIHSQHGLLLDSSLLCLWGLDNMIIDDWRRGLVGLGWVGWVDGRGMDSDEERREREGSKSQQCGHVTNQQTVRPSIQTNMFAA